MSGPSKPFPSNELLERRVLEALVGLPAEAAEVLDLDVACFYSPLHARVFQACKALSEQRRAIDAVLVLSQLGGYDGDPEARSFIASVGFPDLTHLSAWCDTLRDLRALRCVQEEALRIAAAGYEHAKTPGAYLDHASTKLAAAFEGRAVGVSTDTVGTLLGQVMDDYDLRRANAPTRIVCAGFKKLDDTLGGLEPGRLYVVAGRAGMGKSSLGMQLAMNVAIQGHLALVFNLEMKPKEVARRLLSIASGVEGKTIKNANATDDQLARMTRKSNDLSKLAIEFPRSIDMTIEQVRRVSRGRVRAGLRVVVVDYLQLIKTTDKLDNREQQVATVSRGLKAMALELDIPVIAMAQLNREADKRGNQRPNLSDLRESGAIEQDADVVMLLYRDEYYNANTPTPNMCEVIVAKNRDGETGVIKMGFHGQYTRFSDNIPEVRYG